MFIHTKINTTLDNTYPSVLLTLIKKKIPTFFTATCEDGDVRLVDGDSEYEGLVEVCLSQRWGTVNGDGWSSVDTRVVCRQLGYPTEGYYGSTSAA